MRASINKELKNDGLVECFYIKLDISSPNSLFLHVTPLSIFWRTWRI